MLFISLPPAEEKYKVAYQEDKIEKKEKEKD